MTPAANGPLPVMYARAGVGTTPTTWTSTPRLVAPAAIAETNMSPDRRVSWPTTISPPGPTSRFATARPSAYATVGLRSTFATPRIPSVPNRRGMVQLPDGAGPGAVFGAAEAAGSGVIVTVTFAGLAATSVSPVGRFALTGTSCGPAARPVTSRSTTSADADSRSRSAVEPPIVTSTRSVESP